MYGSLPHNAGVRLVGVPNLAPHEGGGSPQGSRTRPQEIPCLPAIACVVQVSSPQQQNSGLCFNVSLGISGSLSGPVVGPVGVGGSGGSALGLSYGGSLLDTSIFLQFQASAFVGAGVFAGVGIGVAGGQGSVPDGITSTTTIHSEVNVGAGLGGSASFDLAADGTLGAGGYAGNLPGGRLGVGLGAAAGVGVSTITSVGAPTLRDLLRSLGLNHSQAAICAGVAQ